MPQAKANHYHEADVIIGGRSNFPADMLRYDACYPKSGRDVDAICTLAHERNAERWANPNVGITIQVCRITPHKATNVWTIERWRSFGVTIQPTCPCCRPSVTAAFNKAVAEDIRRGKHGLRDHARRRAEPVCPVCGLVGSECDCLL